MAEQVSLWPFGPLFGAPGNLVQPILPDWSLQRVEVNFAGDLGIEKDVVAKVASYGRQLGILTDAVLALAGKTPNQGAFKQLQDIAEEIAKIKKARQSDLAGSARRAMESLAKVDRGAAERIARVYAKNSGATRSST
jgi:hypothetical protein